MRGMKTRLLSGMVALLLAGAAGATEILRLESGRGLTGDVLRANDRAITLKSPSGVQTYALNEFDAASRKHLLETVLTNALPPPVIDGTNSAEIERAAVAPDRAQEPRASTDEIKSAGRFVGGLFGAVIAAWVLLFVSYVGYCVQGFRESILWGVLNLLLFPFAPAVFTLFNFRASVWPLASFVAGVALLFGAPALGFWLGG